MSRDFTLLQFPPTITISLGLGPLGRSFSHVRRNDYSREQVHPRVSTHGSTCSSLLINFRVLISAPRRSAAVPNVQGTLALYTVSTYSFESHKKTTEIRAINIKNGQSTLITNEEKTSEPNWLGSENEVLWLKGNEDGTTELVVGSAEEVGKSYIAGRVPGPISDVRVKPLGNDKVAIAFTAKSKPNGTLFNPETEPKKMASGKLYDSLMVRHWDTYVTPERNAIWYGVLSKAKPHITESSGRYSLSHISNALQRSDLECPIPPFGGSDHFDLSSHGIIFVAKDPTLDPAFNTKCDFYYVSIPDFSKPSPSLPQKAEVEGLEGAASSPAFSPSGKGAAFLKMTQNGYESDKNRLVHIPDLSKLPATNELIMSTNEEGPWDRSPSSVSWAGDEETLLLQAEEHGKGLLYTLAVSSAADTGQLPKPITDSGYVSDARPLAANSPYPFISSNSLIDNSLYTILDPSAPANVRQLSSNSRNGSSFSLSSKQVSEIWFKGSGDYEVHAWVVKPSTFDPSQKYPLAYLIHGGPQGAWNDQWSTRWNPAVFAEQGYVVITPNPTGSTGYGQAFTDAIKESWGGRPYEDLVAGFEYIKSNLSYVDTDRAVALGASYGGYMMNWMQGHALGKEFKALVCHDSVFSMANQMSSDEQYFPNHDLGGPYYKAMKTWDKWDPSRFVGEWETPMLVIHNGLDYRLPIRCVWFHYLSNFQYH